MSVYCDVRGQQVMYFTGGSIIMDLRLGQMRCFKVKVPWWICFLQTHSFSHNKTLIDKLEWCGLLWCFHQLFGLSFWRHPFTAEDPLVSNISPNLFLWRNKLIYIEDEQIFILSELFLQCDALHLCELRRTDFIHSLNHTSWLKDTWEKWWWKAWKKALCRWQSYIFKWFNCQNTFTGHCLRETKKKHPAFREELFILFSANLVA